MRNTGDRLARESPGQTATTAFPAPSGSFEVAPPVSDVAFVEGATRVVSYGPVGTMPDG
jgi:hypothetical protein